MTQWSGSDLQRGTSPAGGWWHAPVAAAARTPRTTRLPQTHDPRPPRRLLPCRHERGRRSAQRGRQQGAHHGETLNPYGRQGRSAAAARGGDAPRPHQLRRRDGICRAPCDPSLSPAARHDVLAVIGTFRSLRTGNPASVPSPRPRATCSPSALPRPVPGGLRRELRTRPRSSGSPEPPLTPTSPVWRTPTPPPRRTAASTASTCVPACSGTGACSSETTATDTPDAVAGTDPEQIR